MKFASRSVFSSVISCARPSVPLSLITISFFCLMSRPLPAQTPPAGDEGYFKYQKVMVPMRDGVKLETVILTPRDQREPLPILLTRTPYGVPTEKDYAGYHPQPESLDADGY